MTGMMSGMMSSWAFSPDFHGPVEIPRRRSTGVSPVPEAPVHGQDARATIAGDLALNLLSISPAFGAKPVAGCSCRWPLPAILLDMASALRHNHLHAGSRTRSMSIRRRPSGNQRVVPNPLEAVEEGGSAMDRPRGEVSDGRS